MQKAIKKIVLIDGYVDIGTLNILAKKNPGVDVIIYTFNNKLKDAGKKCFGITQIQDEQTIQDVLNRL